MHGLIYHMMILENVISSLFTIPSHVKKNQKKSIQSSQAAVQNLPSKDFFSIFSRCPVSSRFSFIFIFCFSYRINCSLFGKASDGCLNPCRLREFDENVTSSKVTCNALESLHVTTYFFPDVLFLFKTLVSRLSFFFKAEKVKEVQS